MAAPNGGPGGQSQNLISWFPNLKKIFNRYMMIKLTSLRKHDMNGSSSQLDVASQGPEFVFIRIETKTFKNVNTLL